LCSALWWSWGRYGPSAMGFRSRSARYGPGHGKTTMASSGSAPDMSVVGQAAVPRYPGTVVSLERSNSLSHQSTHTLMQPLDSCSSNQHKSLTVGQKRAADRLLDIRHQVMPRRGPRSRKPQRAYKAVAQAQKSQHDAVGCECLSKYRASSVGR
jgi:hypothetical protein